MSPRLCARPGCRVSIEHLAPQARCCSGACKQFVYRLRRRAVDPEEGPPLVYAAPSIVSTEGAPGEWLVTFDNGETVLSSCKWPAQARSAARWQLARPHASPNDEAPLEGGALGVRARG